MSVKVTFIRQPKQAPTVKVEAIGFTGSTCEAATARVERAIGIRVDQVRKPEFFDEVAADEAVQESEG